MGPVGWKSRKLWLAVLTMGLISIAYLIADERDDLFGEFCMAVLAAAGIYTGSNSAEAIAATRKKPTESSQP